MMCRCAAALIACVAFSFPWTVVGAEVNQELVDGLTHKLQKLYDTDDFGEKYLLLSRRAQLNLVSSTLFGLIRQGHNAEVAKTLQKFNVQSLGVPLHATPEMSAQELAKLRLGQWLYTQQLVEKLGNGQVQFLDDLNQIRPSKRDTKVALRSVTINSNQDTITAELLDDGKPSVRIRFVRSADGWLYDGKDSLVYFSLKPEGIQKEGDARQSPAIIREFIQQGKTDEAIALLDEALAAEPENTGWIGLNSYLVGYLARDNTALALQRSLDQYHALMNRDELDFNSMIALAEAVEFLVMRDSNSSLEEKLAIIDASREKVRTDPDQVFVPLRNLAQSRFKVLMKAGLDDDARKVMDDLLDNYRQRLSGIELGPLNAFVGVAITYISTMQRDFPELAESAHAEALQIVESGLDDEAATVGHFGLFFNLQSPVIAKAMRTDPEMAKTLLDQLQLKCDALRSKLDPLAARGLGRYENIISQIRSQAAAKPKK